MTITRLSPARSSFKVSLSVGFSLLPVWAMATVRMRCVINSVLRPHPGISWKFSLTYVFIIVCSNILKLSGNTLLVWVEECVLEQLRVGATVLHLLVQKMKSLKESENCPGVRLGAGSNTTRIFSFEFSKDPSLKHFCMKRTVPHCTMQPSPFESVN